MDAANKQSAVVAETVIGTTPATPAFLLLRDIRVSGTPNRPANRSPERRADRFAASMTKGLNSYPKSIELAYCRDAANDVLWQSAFGAAFSTNTLKAGSTQQTFTLEEKYSAATAPYRRLTGVQVDSVAIGWTLGQPGSLVFNCKGLAETTATTAIASSTYAAPSPGDDPITPADITVNNLFGISSPQIVALNATLSNNLRDRYKFSSADPASEGFGIFEFSGTVQFYFSQLTDYSTFATRQTGATLDLTFGAVANHKDELVAGNCDVWNPDVSDPGQSGDHLVTLNFMARYFASDTTALKLLRNVA